MFGSHRELSVKQGSHAPIMAASILIAGLGILLAGIFHWKDRPRGERLVARFPQLSRLLEAKYWVDEIYQAGIVEPLRMIGRVMWLVDDWIVDGVVKVLGFAPQVLGFGLKLTVQRGSLQGYGLAMMAMIALIMLVWFAAL
jgi:NADH-quinone oxidoreductase subunit L